MLNYFKSVCFINFQIGSVIFIKETAEFLAESLLIRLLSIQFG